MDNAEPLSISLESAAAGGIYRLQVRLAPDGKHDRESYQVVLSELRPALAEDVKQIEAEDAYAEGQLLRTSVAAEQMRRSLERYQAALHIWLGLHDQAHVAATLNRMADVFHLLGEPKDGLEVCEQALPIWRALGNRRGEAEALHYSARFLNELGRPQQALERYSRALSLRRAIGDHRGEGFTLNNMGSVYFDLGEPEQAVEYHTLALPIEHTYGYPQHEALMLNELGAAYRILGQPQKAIDCYERALVLGRTTREFRSEAYTLDQLGDTNLTLGEPRKAIDHYRQALLRSMAAGDRLLEAATLRDEGRAYAELSSFQTAYAYYTRALKLQRSLKHLPGEADTLGSLGELYLNSSEPTKAAGYFNRARVIWQSLGNGRSEAGMLNSLGELYLKMDEPGKGRNYLINALNLMHAAHDRLGEATVLSNLACAERAVGNLVEARDRIEAALRLTESFRSLLPGGDLRSSYVASVRERYDVLVEILMQLHGQKPGEKLDALAFEASEHARARTLLDLLNNAHADIREGVDLSLLQQERSLQASLRAKSEREIRLLREDHTDEQVVAVQDEIRAITARYSDVQSAILARSPRYGALTHAQTVTLDEVQQVMLDPDTLLLEYALGRERSFLWAITRDAFMSYELPRQSVIETVARQAYLELSTNNPTDHGRAVIALNRLLLDPVAGQLGHKRLLIVAEGALQFVPFGALHTDRGPPLIAEHEVVNLPSVSTLAVLRRELATRKPAPKLVAVLADPVFSAEDPRVSHRVASGAHSPNPEKLERSAKDSGLLNFDRLVSSRREAHAIVACAGKNASWAALDFDASRRTATRPELAEYRIVHFASHALLDSRHPELSGIVLSLVDREGRPQDGFLQVQEVYNLKLNADLVVLSACQTALGKEVRGEGLIGLTRGFMYAGAPRVVASLWRIPDQATAELMTRFYSAMLKDGTRPAAALQAAQVSIQRDPRWAAPYYWAGFVLQGEWK